MRTVRLMGRLVWMLQTYTSKLILAQFFHLKKFINFLILKISTFASLKKVVAISFLTIYLFSATELNQLLKLPVLISHFIEHRQENHELNVLKFLYLHYAIEDDNEKDNDMDMKLPFKSAENSVASNLSVFIPIKNNITIDKPITTIKEKINIYSDRFLASVSLSSIWQPPKI